MRAQAQAPLVHQAAAMVEAAVILAVLVTARAAAAAVAALRGHLRRQVLVVKADQGKTGIQLMALARAAAAAAFRATTLMGRERLLEIMAVAAAAAAQMELVLLPVAQERRV